MVERDRRRVAQPRRDGEQVVTVHDPSARGRVSEVVGHSCQSEPLADGLPDLAPPHAPVQPLPALRLGDQIAGLRAIGPRSVEHLAELWRDGDGARREPLGGLDAPHLNRSPNMDRAASTASSASSSATPTSTPPSAPTPTTPTRKPASPPPRSSRSQSTPRSSPSAKRASTITIKNPPPRTKPTASAPISQLPARPASRSKSTPATPTPTARRS